MAWKVPPSSRRQAVAWIDRDAAVRDLNAAYAENGKRRPRLDPTEPVDADTPDIPRPFWCNCGTGFLARRDRDQHRYDCDIAVAAYTGTYQQGP